MASAMINSYDVLICAERRISALNEAIRSEIEQIPAYACSDHRRSSLEDPIKSLKDWLIHAEHVSESTKTAIDSKYADKLSKLHSLKNLATLARKTNLSARMDVSDEEASLLLEE